MLFRSPGFLFPSRCGGPRRMKFEEVPRSPTTSQSCTCRGVCAVGSDLRARSPCSSLVSSEGGGRCTRSCAVYRSHAFSSAVPGEDPRPLQKRALYSRKWTSVRTSPAQAWTNLAGGAAQSRSQLTSFTVPTSTSFTVGGKSVYRAKKRPSPAKQEGRSKDARKRSLRPLF